MSIENLRKGMLSSSRPKIELTAEEQAQIDKNKEIYHQKMVNSRKSKVYKPIELNNLKKIFKKVFEETQGRELELNEYNTPILDLMCRYFAKDKSFNDTELTMNIPSLNKGILLIGKYGCGKSSMMETFQEIGKRLMPNNFMWFVSISTLEMVDEFESSNNTNKEAFFKKYNEVNVVYFDDFGTEDDASNYGKKNIMKEVIEKRYLKKKKTMLSTNFTLLEIKERYGNRVFDRLQEMFNIIEFKGDTFRE